MHRIVSEFYLLTAGVLLLATVGGATADELPDELPVNPEITDPALAILVGLVDADIHATLTGDRLRAALERLDRPSRLPHWQLVQAVRERGGRSREAELTLEFTGPLDLPVPYSILGYHPGSFRTSRECRFHELYMGKMGVTFRDRDAEPGQRQRRLNLDEVRLFGLADGEVEVDIDGWLDRMMGSRLSDARLVGVALCRYEGDLLGLAMGYDEDGRGKISALNLSADEVMFPATDELKTIGRTLRRRIELLLRTQRAKEQAAGARPGLPGE